VPQSSPLTAGLTPEALYFSELNPSTILPAGLGGPLVTNGAVLLAACNTDWKRWNGQAETDKTAMLLRSEREAKPSGAALVELTRGQGRLIVCGLPAAPETPKADALNRTILANLGLKLGAGTGPGSALSADGVVTHALAWGWAGAASVADGLADMSIDPNSDSPISDGTRAGRYTWRLVGADAHGNLDLSPLRAQGDQAAQLAYLSFWLYSPKALDNLLLDPHLPNVGLQIGPAAAARVWLNGKAIQTTAQGGGIAAPTLLLQKGVNHVLVKVVRAEGEGGAKPALKLVSSQPDYLTLIRGTVEKP
jgi:beta-galactosidase